VPDHVVFGYCHGGVVRAEFAASLLALAMEGATPLDAVIAWESGPNIATARNQIVHKFLTGGGAAWLLMADTDMVFAADAGDRLIAAADPVSGRWWAGSACSGTRTAASRTRRCSSSGRTVRGGWGFPGCGSGRVTG
jgi:hypothetical protein